MVKMDNEYENEKWWDDIEYDFFKSLPSNDKLLYMYDLYCGDYDDDEYNDYDDVDSAIDKDKVFNINELIMEFEDIPIILTSENKNEIHILSSNIESVRVISSKLAMNGIILEKNSEQILNSKCKVTYRIINITQPISIN